MHNFLFGVDQVPLEYAEMPPGETGDIIQFNKTVLPVVAQVLFRSFNNEAKRTRDTRGTRSLMRFFT